MILSRPVSTMDRVSPRGSLRNILPCSSRIRLTPYLVGTKMSTALSVGTWLVPLTLILSMTLTCAPVSMLSSLASLLSSPEMELMGWALGASRLMSHWWSQSRGTSTGISARPSASRTMSASSKFSTISSTVSSRV